MGCEHHEMGGGFQFFCNTADVYFGPIIPAKSYEEMDRYRNYLVHDPRRFEDYGLRALWNEFRDIEEGVLKIDLETGHRVHHNPNRIEVDRRFDWR